jgi:SP family general alpha glucoside:H+ symporter-like MFS transporter
LAYAIVGEVSSTRLRAKSVGLARNVYNITKIVAGLLATYQINPTAWNWKGKAGFFWVSTHTCLRRFTT